MRKCCVSGCRSNYSKPYVSVFQFPKRRDIQLIWLKKVKRPSLKVSDNVGVCVKHFEKHFIIEKEQWINGILQRGKVKLKLGAIPTIFNEFEEADISMDVSISRNKKKGVYSCMKADNKTSHISDDYMDSSDVEKSIATTPTTDKPIITVIKAQVADTLSSDEEDLTLERLRSPIIKTISKKIIHDLPSPYKHLPAVSVCLKEEDRIVLPQDLGKPLKRSSSICSSSSNGASEVSKSLSQPKRRKVDKQSPIVLGRQNDCYCWVCHRENIVLCCIACPRAYHQKCAGEITEPSDWVCPECQRILTAENVDTRSSVLSEISLDKLCALLRFCLSKMKHRAGVAFHQPVSLEHYPMYLHYVIHPMDFCLLEKNIKQKLYGCTEAFLSDVKWILHNSCVFNGIQHPLSTNAKTMVKTCENDMQEIEVCPDCFMHSVIRNKYWFADVCRKPHPLVWAKLKGFPYWPAKVVRILDGNVDARFFGAHDRAWVPISQCYHLSKEMPTTSKPKKKGNYETALDELNVHVQLLIQKFGTFEYAPCRTTFYPKNKIFMYHGIDIDKIDKEEIPIDPLAAKNKEFCSSPLGDRSASTESKIDIDQSEEVSSNSLLSTAGVRSPRISSVEVQKEVSIEDKDKTECITVSENNEKTPIKESDLNTNSCDKQLLTKSQSTSSIPRDKLESVLERIKGIVSKNNEEEKESSSKEDELERTKIESETNVSKSETSIILAGLIKSKTLPKLDLPDIPVVEAELSSKENSNFLDMSKKNDMFKLHLLETIKKAQSRTAAEDEDAFDDVETLDKDDSDSESVIDEEDEEDDDQEGGEDNESDEQEEDDASNTEKTLPETVNLSDENAADESSSESETSSESSDTDIEEIEIEDAENSVCKNTESIKENSNNEIIVIDKERSGDGILNINEPINILNSCDPPVSDIESGNCETKCISNEITHKENPGNNLLESTEINTIDARKSPCIDQEINIVEQQSKSKDSTIKNVETNKSKSNSEENIKNKDKTNSNNVEDDDEIIICPPVKPPTPPLICLDDGTETEPENDDKSETKPVRVMDNSSSVKNSNVPSLRTTEIVGKPSAVRTLKFKERKRSDEATSSATSSNEDSSEDELIFVNRERGLPLSGAKRTFNNLKNRTASQVTGINMNAKSGTESCVLSPTCPVSRPANRRISEEKTSEKSPPLNEHNISMEHDAMSDGSVQDSAQANASITEKETEILRLKKKLSCLFTAFQLQHWKHTQEKAELRHNMNLVVMEMRASLEADKKHAIETLSRTLEREKQRCIEEAKKNQWCAFCFKEARYQCCWNTNYCTVACQKRHFSLHRKLCTQLKNKVNAVVMNESKPPNSTLNELKEGKKLFVVNMMPKVDSKTPGEISASGNLQQVTLAKSQIQVVPPKTTLSLIQNSSIPTSSQLQIVPNKSFQYILAPVKPGEITSSPQQQVTVQEEKPTTFDSCDVIKNVTHKNSDLPPAISILKKNLETESAIKKDESKVEERDLEEIYFPSPPQINFEGLDTASPDESIYISQVESSEKNSSDTEILSQGEKREESSTEEDVIFSDNDEADNEPINIGFGVKIKAKFLNKCLIYGKTAKRLTRCLVDVLFPDLKLLAACSTFGLKSNVTKLTRAALPANKVSAILDFVQKRYPTATRKEIVLAINMKCKEARTIVDREDSEKPKKRSLFRRLLARDQNLETNKIASLTSSTESPTLSTTSLTSSTASPITSTASPTATNTASPTVSSTVSPSNVKPPVTTVTIMRQPISKRICVKSLTGSLPLNSEVAPSSANLVPNPNVLHCPQVLIRPRYGQPGTEKGGTTLPRLPRQTVRTLLSNAKEPKKIIMPLEVFKHSPVNISPKSVIGNSPRPYIIIGTPVTTAPQSLSVTQPSSLPSVLRK